MFQAWEVKISTIAASSAAKLTGSMTARLSRTTGRNDRIGTLWSTSSSGISMRSALRFRAAAYP
jgi:hypothetical protein